jgi:hypothetical protein
VIFETLGSLIVGVVGAGIGWTLTEFVARPIRKFFDLRGEVIRRLAQYADIPVLVEKDGEVKTPVVTEETQTRTREAESVMRDLAAQMLSFAYSETFASRILALRYSPRDAGEGLFAIAWTLQASGDLKNRPRERVAKALRIHRSLLF